MPIPDMTTDYYYIFINNLLILLLIVINLKPNIYLLVVNYKSF